MGDAEVGEDDGIYEELAKQTERKIKMRRRALLVSTAVIFTLTAILLFISVAQIQGYQVTPPPPPPLHPPLTSYDCEELECEETDWECLALICPQGWHYNHSQHRCYLPEGQASKDFLYK